MDLGVVSACYFSSMRGLPITRSAYRANLHLVPYGLKQEWRGFYEGKIVGLYSALKRFPHKYVLYCDAADVKIRAGSRAIIQAYKSVDGEIVISGDAACYPFTQFEPDYRVAAAGRMFPFLCAGVFMGPTAAIIEALEWMMWSRLSHAEKLVGKLLEDDQSYWMLYERAHPSRVRIDHDARLVVSLNHFHQDWLLLGASINSLTLSNGHCPPILHFNGERTKHMLDEVTGL